MSQENLSRTTLTFTILLFVFACTLPNISSSNGKSVSSNVITVDPNGSIQEAINRANPGDTIIISQGTYKQWEIVVNKTLKIVGENLENTIIDGNGTARVIFQIVANNVVIENFTLQNTSTDYQDRGTAIRIFNTANVQVSKVIAKNNYCGIELLSANFTKVANCKISNSTWGIHVHNKSINNTISGNTMANNSIGVYISDSYSRYNMFYHNNFVNNTSQASVMSINYFDKGYPCGGNHWSDHNKTDLKHGVHQNEGGSDGIVDEAYYRGGATDNYPLAYPVTTIEIVVGEEKFEVKVSTNSRLITYTFSHEAKSLTLLFIGTDATNSSCRVSIPKELLSCNQLSQWNITLSSSGQSSPLDYLALEDAETTYLYFSYNQSDSFEIETRGTKAIPEFPSLTAIMILLATATATTIFLKSRFSKKR